jgi:RNA polymerase sigma-70 factor, ECF subfamily
MQRELSDSQLIGKLRLASDYEKKEILLLLYDRYKHLVLKVCYYYLADYDSANDLFHDVFVRVIENAEKLNNPSVFKSWLMSITRNLCVDYLRKTSYLKDAKPLAAEIEVACDERAEDKLIAEMDKQKILTHLSSCVQRLDTFQLSVFKLRWQGLRAAQIVKIMKTDRGQLRRSYDKIKRTLETCMEGNGFKIYIDQIISLGEVDE